MRKDYKFRSQFGFDAEENSDACGVLVLGPSLTVQSQAEDADLNVIVKRFGLTGQMPQDVRVPMYGDFSEISDFRSAWEAVRAAEEEFMKVPAEVRARFGNDPQKFLEFCADEVNIPEMRKLGLHLPEVTSGSDAGVSRSVGASAGASGAASGAAAGANAAPVAGGSGPASKAA